jgi:signal transduction histidine kinase
MSHSSVDGRPSVAAMIQDNPLVLPSHTQALHAVQLMSQSSMSCIIVADGEMDDRQVVGIFTERDLVRASAQAKHLHLLKLSDLMTTPVVTQVREHITDLFDLLQPFRQHGIRHLPIVSLTGNPIGIVSQESLRQALRPGDLLRLRRVDEVMTSAVIQAMPQDSIQKVAFQMAHHKVSCLVVTEDDRPVGIITERDLVRFQALQLDLATTQARTVMSAPLYPITLKDSLWKANETMRNLRVRRLVVTQPTGRLAGIITQTDIVKTLDPLEMFAVVETLQRTIEERTSALAKEINDRKTLEEQLQRALFSANVAHQSKNEFLAHMSHELRTPLTAILGFTELLSTDLTLGDDNCRYLDTINRSGKYLLSLINDLLDMAKLESGHLQLRQGNCNLNSLILDLERLFRQRSLLKGLTFQVHRSLDLPHSIVTDEKKLRQILINLIGNAIKFTDTGGVTFSIQMSSESERSSLVFQVEDTGVGISMNDRLEIFTPFFQVTTPGRLPEGNGLGLAISQQLAKNLGGLISLSSSQSVGCTFRLEIPLGKPQEHRSPPTGISWFKQLRQAALMLNHADCQALLQEARFFLPRDTHDLMDLFQVSLDRFDFEGIVQMIDRQMTEQDLQLHLYPPLINHL